MERRRNVFYEALNNSTSRHSRLKSRIQFQAQETERLMRQHFQTLHQFLKEEEENRVAALKDEEHRKMEELETSEEQRIQAVLFRARAVEGVLGENGATFQEVKQ
ncbi:uncharacterized protein LOC103023880 isoform X2 [Astyanax mexicanus]|uniref:uncharacterized protein LOC103023880 isoform X1 n=1 Tax=Astyanax mexicanus TaxID=7994 RepID=UPI0020CB0BAC|nr:uncharacterized protein LOC103023880 isoform X1 [Astyanax mexicanus]XP_049325617.1 uncharacterized protein LOC103023880 isoform X2 [Astyanax mexicanus]